jgi:hypothetical protein
VRTPRVRAASGTVSDKSRYCTIVGGILGLYAEARTAQNVLIHVSRKLLAIGTVTYFGANSAPDLVLTKEFDVGEHDHGATCEGCQQKCDRGMW